MTGGGQAGHEPDLLRAQFKAMASPCEALIDTRVAEVAQRAALAVSNEAFRIEQKFSRYRADNLVHAINTANGAAVEVDGETADLLDYAAHCYQLSGGLFDITSGALRRAWRFDGSDRLPAPGVVEEALKYVGWHKVSWQRPRLRLAPGMEIDFGGIGKEYAVDRAATLGAAASGVPILVNFGGIFAPPARARTAPPGTSLSRTRPPTASCRPSLCARAAWPPAVMRADTL